MNNEGDKVAKKEKSPETKSKMWKTGLNDREFNIALMKKLNEVKKGSSVNSGIKLMKKRSTLPNRQTIKKNQTEILEFKNSTHKMRNAFESIGN